MITEAEELEVMRHVLLECRCYGSFTCPKCEATANGFIASRSDSLANMVAIGYITYERGAGFVQTEAGKARYDALSAVVGKIQASASVSSVSTKSAEQEQSSVTADAAAAHEAMFGRL